jgi:3-oxoacyl-[acyl-carrier protein] reductase
VNNAGGYAFSPIETLTSESINAMFSVYVFGLMLATRAASPLFRDEGGRIINIGSVIGEIAAAQASIYAGTKGSLNSITRVFAKELAPRRFQSMQSTVALFTRKGSNQLTPKTARSKRIWSRTHHSTGPLWHAEGYRGPVTYLPSTNSGWITGSLIDASEG